MGVFKSFNEKNNMNNKIPIILGILSVIFISGCTDTGQILGSGESNMVCNTPYIIKGNECCLDQNDNKICDTDESMASQSLKQECPYECCSNGDYKLKTCSGGLICENNRCIKPDCPYECCEGNYYKVKDCNYNEDCINNQCVIAECPYDCCTGTDYQTRICSDGYVCVNNLCEEIKKPKLSLSIDVCHESINIFQGLGEVIDVYVTLDNYGTKEAKDVQIISTSSDIDQILASSKAMIGSLGANKNVKFKLTLDTKSGESSYVTVSANCDECQTVSTSSGDCTFDWEFYADKLAEYGTEIVGAVTPG